MRILRMKSAIVTIVAAVLVISPQTSSASPRLDSRILEMIPEGADVVASLTRGQQLSYVATTGNNTAPNT